MSGHTGGARWFLPLMTILLLVLGTATAAVALTLALSGSDGSVTSPDASPTSSPAPEVPALSGDQAKGSSNVATGTPVTDLPDPAWVAGTARVADIPERALAAYAGASIAIARSDPGCGLGWNTLAAIGLVESGHGTIDGTTLAASGDTTPPIIGVPLDGKGVAEVRDTDRGRIDDDTTWDRAVGPMQFIPETWRRHATDGNGDGVKDIHNIDDAAMSAAVYLCSSGGDLTQPDDWIAALSAYNPDTGYNNQVAEAATGYADVDGD